MLLCLHVTVLELIDRVMLLGPGYISHFTMVKLKVFKEFNAFGSRLYPTSYLG